jgi:hypothetical protein
MGDGNTEGHEVERGPHRWRLMFYFWIQRLFRIKGNEAAPLGRFWLNLTNRGVCADHRLRLEVARIEQTTEGWKVYGIVCDTASYNDGMLYLKRGLCIEFLPQGGSGLAKIWDYLAERNHADSGPPNGDCFDRAMTQVAA